MRTPRMQWNAVGGDFTSLRPSSPQHLPSFCSNFQPLSQPDVTGMVEDVALYDAFTPTIQHHLSHNAARGAGYSICCTLPVSMAAAHSLLEPTFINPLPETDGWGRIFEMAVNDDATSYAIRSYARHGVRDTDLPGGGTSYLDCDIIYSGGQFMQYPQGIQVQ